MSQKEIFGSYLRKLRKSRGMTLVELAKKTDLSQPYLSQIENGKRDIPSVEILNNLKDVLGANAIEFMNNAGITPRVKTLGMTFGFEEPELELQKKTFDIYSVLQMNADVYFKDKQLNEKDKQFLLDLLERTFGNS